MPEGRHLLDIPREAPPRRTALKVSLALAGALVLARLVAPILGGPAAGHAVTPWLLLALCLPVLVGLWALWRKLTYRVGTRLFLSYLLIGGVPLPLLALLTLVIGWALIGQYTSVRFGSRLDRASEEMDALSSRVLSVDPAVVPDLVLLERFRTSPPPPVPRLEVAVCDGTRELLRSPGAPAELCRPRPPGASPLPLPWTGPLSVDSKSFLGVVRQRGSIVLAVLLPLDAQTARLWAAGQWFDLSFDVDLSGSDGDLKVEVGSPDAGASGRTVRVDGHEVEDESWGLGRPVQGGFWRGRNVVWFRAGRPPLDWSTGQTGSSHRPLVLLRTSPVDAWQDFVSSPYRVDREILLGLGSLATGFAVVYLMAVVMAAVLIISIARATARLTRGAQAVAAGDLSYRIPVRRRDQLGDLALAFNAMTEAVGRMLQGVAEKERMKREMELAREVQQSLLPETVVVHGGLRMHAHFRPASEVGGDSFDVFRLERGRLLVSVGDVAGHGLSTGLLMAMVKSALAALVREGHRGAQLVERLNRHLLEQSTRQRMATLVLVEVDSASGVLEVTSSGHPPVMVRAPDGVVTEVELSSLPLGNRLPVEPASRTLPFPPGSVVLLYTDGLVEALDEEGRAFGYDGLRAAVEGSCGATAEGVVHAVLAALDRHLAGTLAGDDLTVLCVELPATSSTEGAVAPAF